MTHLTQTQRNETLDSALDAETRQQVEAHLAACPECRAKLDELALVFAALETVPGQALQHDLVPGVLRRLPKQRERSPWRLVLAAQAAAAIALLAWLGTPLTSASPNWLREIGGIINLDSPFLPLTEAWLSLRAWQASLPSLEAPSFQPGATLWAALALAGLAFVVGNALFLRANGKESQE